MAELTFDKIYTYGSIGSSFMCIGNEPDNTVTRFFIEAERQRNDAGTIAMSNYDNLEWTRTSGLLTQQPITRVGIKTFPQIGAIGFYTLKYEPKSLILAPVYNRQQLYSAPSISVRESNGMLEVTIDNPDDLSYDCYRIVVRNGYFADEYVTYSPTILVPSPTAAGAYAVTAFGYLNEQLASQESEPVYITVFTDSVTILATENDDAIIFGDTMLLL